MPIRQSFVVEMVGREDIASAVALNSAAFNAARIVGPAVAGCSSVSSASAPLFLLNSASYLVVIAGYLLMDVRQLQSPVRRHARALGPAASPTRSSRACGTCGRHPSSCCASSLIGVVSLFALNFPVLGPLVARDVLGGGAETYGFLMAAAGVGSLVSALMLAFGGRATLGTGVPGRHARGGRRAGRRLLVRAAAEHAAHGHRRLVDRRHRRHHQHHHPAHGARMTSGDGS